MGSGFVVVVGGGGDGGWLMIFQAVVLNYQPAGSGGLVSVHGAEPTRIRILYFQLDLGFLCYCGLILGPGPTAYSSL